MSYDPGDYEEPPLMYCRFCECNQMVHEVDNGFDHAFGYQKVIDTECTVCGSADLAAAMIEEEEES